MNQWLTLFNKEVLEMARNFKWIWVPITFIVLGVIDPLTTYYMPQILDSVGGLPEGAVIEIPTPTAIEVFIMSMSEYQTIGILIIVLSMMGTIAGERKSGVAQLILVKPVSYISFITSKWASSLVLMLLSLFLGLLASWYYTGILFEFIPFGDIVSAFLLYGLWLVFVVTLVIFFSSLFKHPGMAGAVTLATVFIISMIGSSFEHILEPSPTQLFSYSSVFLTTGILHDSTWEAVGSTAVAIVLFLSTAILVFKRKELAD